MPQTKTPLRYPGGKSKIYKYMAELLKYNNLENCTYIEPFAGGAGLALSLLIKKNVNKIIINDYDYSIYSFWYCTLYRTDEFIKLIKEIPINIDEWHKQQKVQDNPYNYTILEVALSTFFLNRTNRSGILKAGVIGGLQQNNKYKMDCRFNKENLIKKINKISSLKNKIRLYNMDVIDFIPNIINNLPEDKILIYFDPPYIVQGSNLYYNFFKEDDHRELSELIKELEQPWMVTYDNEPLVYDLYNNYTISELELTYSAGTKRKGTELLIYGNNISVL